MVKIMMTKQKLALITTIILLVILVVCINIPRYWSSEQKNAENYKAALNDYNNNNFQQSYSEFAKISKSSRLKPAAIYRQALCSDRLLDSKASIKKYKELVKYYPNSVLSIRAKYMKAQAFYNAKKFKKAKKEFKYLLKKYPKSDYAIASEYFLASLEVENLPKIHSKKKLNRTLIEASGYFRDYLKEAPNGRYAVKSIQKWTKLKIKMTNEDNLVIAKAYIENKDYDKAKKYLNMTDIGVSWPYFVKNEYKLKNNAKVKYYAELGLKNKGAENVSINEENSGIVQNQEIYEAIDTYLKVSNAPQTAIQYLLSISQESNGYDYILYKSCNNMPTGSKLACYNTLYSKFPKGQFAAETLANIFYEKIKLKQYFVAKKIGQQYLSSFIDSKSAPRVMFWMGKLSERMKNYEDARSYYKSLISKFPDDYYAYQAFLNLNKFNIPVVNTDELEGKDVLFPYKRNVKNDLIIALAQVEDYGLINELCKDDPFIQSWLAYQQGNYSTSALLARDAMEKLEKKPPRNDLRWRLVYPVHYYEEIRRNALTHSNSPIIILSIIREESYFNSKIKSPVGAAGLMQLMPATAREVGAKYGYTLSDDSLLLKPAINIELGNMYYAQLKSNLMNKDFLAVLAYNGGIGSVSKWKSNLKYDDVDDFIEQIPYPETQNYFKKVYRSYWNYIRIYSN